MAINAASLQWGPGNQYAYDPTSQTYYQGQFKNPTENDPNNTSMWGYNTLSPGATQWLPSTNGWNGGMQTLSSSDFDLSGLSPDKAALFSGDPIIGSFKNAPVAKEVTQAPDEGFMASFMNVAPFFLGAAAPFLFPGAAAGAGALGPGESAVAGNGVWSGGNFLGGAAGAANGGNMAWYDDFLQSIGIDPSSVSSFSGSPTNADIMSQIGAGADTMGAVPPTGGTPGAYDYNQFMRDIGIDPASTTPFTGSPTNAQIMQQIGANPSALQQLQQIMQQTGLPPTNALKLLGQLGAAGLGMLGANRQTSALQNLSGQYANYGAPYRAMLAQSYADPASFLANSPDIQASVNQGTNALARSLSRGGNPTGSGAALQELQNYATQRLYGQLGNERNRLANFGGLSNFNAAAPGLAGQAISSQGGSLNALGSAISSITNPPITFEQVLNALNGNQGLNTNLNTGTGLV